jgi:Tol biopolymer transport system component
VDGDAEIFSMKADGTRLRQLTRNRVAEADPDWAPDGKQLTFESKCDGDFEIRRSRGPGPRCRSRP